MTPEIITIRGSRIRLLIQASVIVLFGAAAGFVLQRWEFVASSLLGRLDDQLPIPLVASVVTALAVAIAVALIRDSWTHRIELRAQELQADTGRGTFVVRYDAISDVKKIPWYGVGIAMRDPAAWLDEQATRPGAPATLRPVSELLRTTYGVDVAFLQKNLDVPASRVVELIQSRRQAP